VDRTEVPVRKDETMGWGTTSKVALAASLLAGCAADSSLLEQAMVVPGYYDTLGCPELVAKLRVSTERVRELILLMEKSGEDSAGAIVNVLAYNTEYAKARSAQKHAEEAAVRKRCDLNAVSAGKPAAESDRPASGPEVAKPLR
jgi:hypothetical protein